MVTFVCFAAALIFAWFYFKEKSNSAAATASMNRAVAELNAKDQLLQELANENVELAPYKAILDIENECQRLREESKADLATSRKKSEAVLSSAAESAQKIIEKAEEEAKRVAGSALETLEKASSLEATAKAMKNIIEGYGDQYLKPTASLLDTLGEEYSHTDAGSELKKSRETTKNMMKQKLAASCDYVESNRKETAVNFVLDAFNGKVDSILSNVKEDNFGTLEQKIKDAFETVNFNGAAFRNAKINREYLNARIDELKWASTVQALKEKDRAEQKAIRDQIRDEEKAAKEIEKALKEAAKEDETLKKAMAKVREEMQGATEQKIKEYEEKYRSMEARLLENEENKQRALSMAQQTKRGHVYIISNIGSFGEGIYKIGLTRRLQWQDRVDELGDASVPFEFDVHGVIFSEDAPALEYHLHQRFDRDRLNLVNSRKEFFRATLNSIKDEIDVLKTEVKWVHWTFAAAAQEYRESSSIRVKMEKNDKAA